MAKQHDEQLREEILRLAMARDAGALSKEDEDRLEWLILSDDAAGELFADHLLQTVSLRAWASAQSELVKAKAAATTDAKNLPWITLRQLHPWHHPVRFGTTVLSLTLVFWLAFLFFVAPRLRDQPDVADNNAPKFVAELTGLENATWSDNQLAPHQGAFLVRGRKLELLSGLAEITFRSGAVVTVEGPATLELRSKMRCELLAGTVNAEIPESAIGFAIDTPVASVVDLGTAFGMHVEPDGASNVEVFAGKVRVESQNSDEQRLLSAGDVVRVDASGLFHGEQSGNEIVRRLPQLASTRADEFIAYQVSYGVVGNQEFCGSLGHDFVVNRPIEVTYLGAFDSGADGLKRTITVQLWRRDDGGTPEFPADDRGIEMIAAATFTPDEAGLLAGSNRLKKLEAPILLPPGAYTIVAHGYGLGEPVANDGGKGSFHQFKRVNLGANAITLVGSSRFGDVPGEFPNKPDGGPTYRYCAGTFAFRAPTKNRDSTFAP